MREDSMSYSTFYNRGDTGDVEMMKRKTNKLPAEV